MQLQVGQHIYKRKNLQVFDSESSLHENLDDNGNYSDTTWYVSSETTSSDDDEDLTDFTSKPRNNKKKSKKQTVSGFWCFGVCLRRNHDCTLYRKN